MKVFSRSVFLGVFLAFNVQAQQVQQISQAKLEGQTDKQKPYLMAAMGDSISAGFLASTRLSWFNDNSLFTDAENYYDLFSTMDQAKIQPQVAFDVQGAVASLFEHRDTLSWTTGKSITSHYMLLKDFLAKSGTKVSSYNVAISGGVTSDLFTEVDAITDKMNSGKYAGLKYVTLLIGNNDACHKLSQATMKANLHEVFRRLSTIQQSEPIRVLMSGIPRIPDVGQADVAQSKTVLDLTCRQLKENLTHSCLDLADWKSQDQYVSDMDYVQQINELLDGAAQDANSSFSNLNVVFTNRLFEADISQQDLAVDCFHPNTTSQGRISQELWQDQPWFH